MLVVAYHALYGVWLSSDFFARSSARRAGPGDGERTRLTRSAVVDRAMQLADASGLDALTIRKLATELGVTPMALYWHFRSKDELLDGLAERVWTEIDLDVDPRPWPDQLRALLKSLLQVLRAHPAAPSCCCIREDAVRVLPASDGDHPRTSYDRRIRSARRQRDRPLRPVDRHHAGDERAGDQVTGRRRPTELQRKKQVVLATLPPVRYPRLVECAAPMTACDDPDFHYEFGIDMFIAGVQAMADKVRR